MPYDKNTRRRGPIKVGGQDGAVLSNMVNVTDGSLSVNKYGMQFNTRKPYEEAITDDTNFTIWEDLGRPIYFEVIVTVNDFFKVNLIGQKQWADQTEVANLEAGIVCNPGDVVKIYDEEFTDLFVEISALKPRVLISIFASGFIPDNAGVNQYRTKIDMNR